MRLLLVFWFCMHFTSVSFPVSQTAKCEWLWVVYFAAFKLHCRLAFVIDFRAHLFWSISQFIIVSIAALFLRVFWFVCAIARSHHLHPFLLVHQRFQLAAFSFSACI